MKLTSPRALQTNINTQRRVDIDQSVKLHTETLAIRKELEDEQVRYELFKNKSIQLIQSEIDNKISELDLLNREIASKKESDAYKKRMIQEESDKLEIEKTRISSLDKLSKELLEEAQKQKNESEQVIKDIKIEEIRQADRNKQVDEAVNLASDRLIQAHERIEKAKQKELSVNAEYMAQIREIEQLEAVLKATVESIEIEKSKLKGERQFIKEEKIRVADMRSTLERAMNRLKN